MILAAAILALAFDYPRECYCSSAAICRAVACSEVAVTPQGLSWASKHWPQYGPMFGAFTRDQVHVSPDGSCHVCIYQDGSGQRELCIFIPEPIT